MRMSLLMDVEDAARLGLVPVASFSLRDGYLLKDRTGLYHSVSCVRLPRFPALRRVRRDMLSLAPAKRCVCVVYPKEELSEERLDLLTRARPLVRLWRAAALSEPLTGPEHVGYVPLVLGELTMALESSLATHPLAASLQETASLEVERLLSLLASPAGSRSLLAALRAAHWSRDTLVWGDGVSVVDVSTSVVSPRHVDAVALWAAFGKEVSGRRLVVLPVGAAPLVRTAFPGDAQAFPIANVGVIPDAALEVFLTLWSPGSNGPMSDPLLAVEAAKLVLSR